MAFMLAERESKPRTLPEPPKPRPVTRPKVTNEQRLILTNAEQVLQEFCLDFQVHGSGTCDACPLYLPDMNRCAKGIVGQAKHMIRCPQSTTEGGAEPCRS